MEDDDDIYREVTDEEIDAEVARFKRSFRNSIFDKYALDIVQQVAELTLRIEQLEARDIQINQLLDIASNYVTATQDAYWVKHEVKRLGRIIDPQPGFKVPHRESKPLDISENYDFTNHALAINETVKL